MEAVWPRHASTERPFFLRPSGRLASFRQQGPSEPGSARMPLLASTERPDGPEAGPASFARAGRAHTGTPFFCRLTRVLKRPIVCSEGVKVMMQEPQATGTVLFSTKRSTCTTTDSRTPRPTRARLSQSPSRPVWSVSPTARRTSGDLCVQRTVDHPSAARPRFRWLACTCATKQPSIGTPPATCSRVRA